MTITSITGHDSDSETRPLSQETERDEPIRLHFTRSASGWKQRAVRDMPEVRARRGQLVPLMENDWFRQGNVCVIERHWTEIDQTTGGPRYCHENVKGRLLGLSRNGRVWALVHFYRPGRPTKKDGVQGFWELRLVDPGDIEPLGYGLKEPPPLPAIWQLKITIMAFDKPKVIL